MAKAVGLKVLLTLGMVAAAASLGSSALGADAADPGEVFNLYSTPVAQGPHEPETSDGLRVRNVTAPTLTLFRPDPAKATGAAVIVCPGGGFAHLSISNEGYEVAKALAANGVTAIVLKYRLNETHPPKGGWPVGGALDDLPPGVSFLKGPHPDPNTSPAVPLAVADGVSAIHFVRAHAAEWKISANKVGVLGFSAGAHVALAVALEPRVEDRPDFAGAIYGAMPSEPVPADAPPLFLGVAADDRVVGLDSVAIFNAWHAAGRDAELHVFRTGGHGFGKFTQGKTSDHWIDEYLWWLDAVTRPAAG
jgi:acetyl esterase/lipase